MSFFFLISGWIAINISHFFNRILNVKKLIKYIIFNHFLKHGVMCPELLKSIGFIGFADKKCEVR
jgi:hypothetical protein